MFFEKIHSFIAPIDIRSFDQDQTKDLNLDLGSELNLP